MNAIQILQEDHVHLRQLLDDLRAATTTQKRRGLAKQIRDDLHIHTTLEEELFYPAVRLAAGGEMDALYFQALEEHRTAQHLVLPDLLRTDPASSKFSGRANVLKEVLELHIDEEERAIFTRAKSLLGAAQLRTLGQRMVERRGELLAKEAHANPLLHPLEAAARIGDKLVRTGSAVLRETVGVAAPPTGELRTKATKRTKTNRTHR